jgi:serine O-acetyltransferase
VAQVKSNEVIFFIKSDLFRYTGRRDLISFLKAYFTKPGFTYSFWLRTGNAFATQNYLLVFYWLTKIILRRLSLKYGMSIPIETEIGRGFYIGHFGGVVINGSVKIGENCNLSHEVTIGKLQRGEKQGYPAIGDNVYIAPGVKIFGNITIGNNVAIGANSVVTDNILDNSVVVGIPGRVVSLKGSKELLQYSLEDSEADLTN